MTGAQATRLQEHPMSNRFDPWPAVRTCSLDVVPRRSRIRREQGSYRASFLVRPDMMRGYCPVDARAATAEVDARCPVAAYSRPAVSSNASVLFGWSWPCGGPGPSFRNGCDPMTGRMHAAIDQARSSVASAIGKRYRSGLRRRPYSWRRNGNVKILHVFEAVALTLVPSPIAPRLDSGGVAPVLGLAVLP